MKYVWFESLGCYCGKNEQRLSYPDNLQLINCCCYYVYHSNLDDDHPIGILGGFSLSRPQKPFNCFTNPERTMALSEQIEAFENIALVKSKWEKEMEKFLFIRYYLTKTSTQI